MKKRIVAMFVLVFLFSGKPHFCAELSELAKRAKAGVATVVALDHKKAPLKFGTGFFIDEDGHLITNHHVLADAFSAKVKTQDGMSYPVWSVVAENREMDLVKLKVEIPDHVYSPLEIEDAFPQIAERIFVIGSPMGLEYTVSDGIVSAVRDIEDTGKVFQISAPISQGSSGSPVLNMNGNVIGVATFQFLQGQNLNFAVPVKFISDLKNMQVPKFVSQLKTETEDIGEIVLGERDPGQSHPPGKYEPEKKTETKIFIHLKNGKVIETDRIWEDGGVVNFVRFGAEMGYPKSSIAKIEKKDVTSESDNITKDFRKPENARRDVKSKTLLYEIWYNNRVWRRKYNTKEKGIEFAFGHDSGEVYSIATADGKTRNDSELMDSAMESIAWKSSYKIWYKDKRIVNGKNLLCLETRGKLGKNNVVFLGYFWSGRSGTVHFIAVTDESVFKSYKPDIIDLLNGLVIRRD